MGKKPRREKPGPKPRHGETMIGMSIRLRRREIEELDKAAAKHGWARTDEIRERLRDTFAAPEPVEAQARGIGNLVGLIIEEIQRRTGQPFDLAGFNQVALHHALQTIIPLEGHLPPQIPPQLEREAEIADMQDKPKLFAELVGLQVGGSVYGDVLKAGGLFPNMSLGLSAERVSLLKSIYRDLKLEKHVGHLRREESWVPVTPRVTPRRTEGDDQ